MIRGTNLGGKESFFIDDDFVFVSERKADSLERNLAYPGDLIFTQRGTLGQVAQVPNQSRYPRYVVSQSQMKLAVDETKACPQYVYYWYRSPIAQAHLASKTLATGVPHINLKILKEFPIALPPLAEQRRIAAILDAAEALRAKRRAALAKLDTLTQSIFLEMFGDPAGITARWPQRQLGDALSFLTSGSRGWAKHYSDSGALFLRIQNVCRDELRLDDVAYVNAPDSAEAKRTLVQAGDVLLSMTADLGRTAVIPDGLGPAHINQHLAILRTNSFVPRFLSAYLTSPTGQRQILGRNRQAVKAGLNFDDIRSLNIPEPPEKLQIEFVHRVEAAERIQAMQLVAAKKLDKLFASLQQRAFRGEL